MRTFLVVISLLILCASVSATPTTVAATAISTNNFTLNGNGVTGTVGWFQWGMDVAGSSWAHTPNSTASGGAINYTLRGSPVYGCTTYFYRACDNTGCGSELSFMTPRVSALITQDYGSAAQNVIDSRFDPTTVFWNAIAPYTNVTTPTFFYAAILALLFGGIWIRTRGTAMVANFTMLCGALAASSATGLQLGLPPEMNALLQAVLYISLTGAILSWTVK
jgi:hypothetical protein